MRPPVPATHLASTVVAPEPTSARLARSFVAQVLERWGCEDPDDVAGLLTSEIVTNAVVRATGAVEVDAALDDSRDRLIVSVVDDHPGMPFVRQPALLEVRGRGLPLVASLARRWGVRVLDHRKSVWFEVTVARQGRQPADHRRS